MLVLSSRNTESPTSNPPNNNCKILSTGDKAIWKFPSQIIKCRRIEAHDENNPPETPMPRQGNRIEIRAHNRKLDYSLENILKFDLYVLFSRLSLFLFLPPPPISICKYNSLSHPKNR